MINIKQRLCRFFSKNRKGFLRWVKSMKIRRCLDCGKKYRLIFTGYFKCNSCVKKINELDDDIPF